jgi:hypothetical protein
VGNQPYSTVFGFSVILLGSIELMQCREHCGASRKTTNPLADCSKASGRDKER